MKAGDPESGGVGLGGFKDSSGGRKATPSRESDNGPYVLQVTILYVTPIVNISVDWVLSQSSPGGEAAGTAATSEFCGKYPCSPPVTHLLISPLSGLF